jgi:hypothetical protein
VCNHQMPQELPLWSYFRLTCCRPKTILKGHSVTHQLAAEVCIVKREGEVAAMHAIKAQQGVCVCK